MENKKYSFIIFDMDGLLVDTEKAYYEGWLDAFEKNGLDIPSSVVRGWAGKSIEYTWNYLKDYTDDVGKIRADREAYVYRQLETGNLPAKPFAREVLETLKARGFTIGLATSSIQKRATDILSALGLFSYIDYPVFASDVARAKPYPDVYLEVMRRAEAASETSLVVEDSLTGAEAAKNAGISVVLVPDGSFSHKEEKIPENVVAQGCDLRKVLEFLLG